MFGRPLARMDNISPQTGVRRSSRRAPSSFLAGTQISVGIIYGLIAVFACLSEGKLSYWSAAAVVFALIAFLSAAFRWGWLIPGLLLGVVLGFFFDAKVKGGDHESQTWETINSVVIWALVGGMAGFFADVFPHENGNRRSDSGKTPR